MHKRDRDRKRGGRWRGNGNGERRTGLSPSSRMVAANEATLLDSGETCTHPWRIASPMFECESEGLRVSACAHIGYIDIYFYCTHLLVSLPGNRKKAEQRSHNPELKTEIKKFKYLSDSLHISFFFNSKMQ